jgi:hypothetical protein
MIRRAKGVRYCFASVLIMGVAFGVASTGIAKDLSTKEMAKIVGKCDCINHTPASPNPCVGDPTPVCGCKDGTGDPSCGSTTEFTGAPVNVAHSASDPKQNTGTKVHSQVVCTKTYDCIATAAVNNKSCVSGKCTGEGFGKTCKECFKDISKFEKGMADSYTCSSCS